MNDATQLAYLVTSVLFIAGIMRLRSPATARSGNAIAAVGMAIALLATLVYKASMPLSSWLIIIGGVAVGAVVGVVSARRVPMTAMPQMVALFNGMGAGAAALVAAGEIAHKLPTLGTLDPGSTVAGLFSVLVGSFSFTGSLIAFGKLQELLTGRPITFPNQNAANGVLFVVLLGAAVYFAAFHAVGALLVGIAAGALVLGVMMVLPVGGADMPVIISLLNSCTGLAAASTGAVIGNNALIIGGTIVGASGTILTLLMSQAMNRSLFNVLFGAFGGATLLPAGASEQHTMHASTVEDVAALLAYANEAIIVPGYGLAVARAQQEVREITDLLEKRGVTVKFAIHPVAGRMPGHMNVLLAEANVPYEQLVEMDTINPEFDRADVALVVGANDVTNPSARNDPSSPIYGMPILNVDHARTVIVLKRGRGSGFAGVDNPLFYEAKTRMLFGDARDSLTKVLASLKEM